MYIEKPLDPIPDGSGFEAGVILQIEEGEDYVREKLLHHAVELEKEAVEVLPPRIEEDELLVHLVQVIVPLYALDLSIQHTGNLELLAEIGCQKLIMKIFLTNDIYHCALVKTIVFTAQSEAMPPFSSFSRCFCLQ